MKIARLGAILSLFFALAPSPGGAATAGLTFVQRPVAVADQSQPLLAVGPGVSPMIYYGTPVEHRIWRSADAGVTWTKKSTPPSVAGSGESTGDSTLAADAAGSVYIANPEGGHYPEVVFTSFDQGDTWVNGAYVGRGRLCQNRSERTWTAAGTAGRVVHVAPCTTETAARFPDQDIYGWVSTNSGATYAKSIIAQDVELVGPAVWGSATSIYVVYVDSERNIRVARSADTGASWSNVPVASPAQLRGFPVIAADDGGTVYVAWSELEPAVLSPTLSPGRVLVARSTDGGATWSEPVIVSDPATSATRPWLVAGASGRIAVVYVARHGGVTSAQLGSTSTVEVAESIDATSATPQLTIDTVATGPASSDFLQADIDDAGNLYVAYPTASDAILPMSPLRLMLAVQTGGQRLR